MRAYSAEGRLLAQLDYEGDAGEDDAPVSHLTDQLGLALCGADPGDEPGGLDCLACADLLMDGEDDHPCLCSLDGPCSDCPEAVGP